MVGERDGGGREGWWWDRGMMVGERDDGGREG